MPKSECIKYKYDTFYLDEANKKFQDKIGPIHFKPKNLPGIFQRFF